MNTALWIAQALLALGAGAASLNKLLVPRELLISKQKMAWPQDFSQAQIRLIASVEMLGVLGLVLPQITGILPILSPIASLGLIALMAGAIRAHLKRQESPFPPLLMIALAAFVAWGRGRQI